MSDDEDLQPAPLTTGRLVNEIPERPKELEGDLRGPFPLRERPDTGRI